jgi:merlin protein
MLQLRSEETADLLAEKVRCAEEESGLLSRKAQEAEREIERARMAAFRVFPIFSTDVWIVYSFV